MVKRQNSLAEINFSLPAIELAPKLIGCELLATTQNSICGGIIIETEAYHADDPASHSFVGPTKRNAAMFDVPGTIYVYKIYGLHHCLNFVCGNSDGQAVLIRALEPTRGLTMMRRRRGIRDQTRLCNGPAKLVQALGIIPEINGRHIADSPLSLRPTGRQYKISNGPRIGISKGMESPWRFYVVE